jgi:hypothetical protein
MSANVYTLVPTVPIVPTGKPSQRNPTALTVPFCQQMIHGRARGARPTELGCNVRVVAAFCDHPPQIVLVSLAPQYSARLFGVWRKGAIISRSSLTGLRDDIYSLGSAVLLHHFQMSWRMEQGLSRVLSVFVITSTENEKRHPECSLNERSPSTSRKKLKGT